MKTCKSVGCCKRLNNWFLQPCSHVGGAGTWLCFCTPLRTAWFPSKFRQQFTIPVCVWCIQIFQSGFQSLNIHMTLMQRVIIPTLLVEAGIFFSTYFFLLSQSKGLSLLNSSTEKRKFGLELVYWAIVSAFILLSSRLKCVSTSTLALRSLYVALVTLGSLEVLLPASPDHKALVEYFYSNFASPSTTKKVKKCFSQNVQNPRRKKM